MEGTSSSNDKEEKLQNFMEITAGSELKFCLN